MSTASPAKREIPIVGREYEWVSPSGRRVPMGKLLGHTSTGLLKWSNGEVTQPESSFVEIKKPLFGFGGKK